MHIFRRPFYKSTSGGPQRDNFNALYEHSSFMLLRYLNYQRISPGNARHFSSNISAFKFTLCTLFNLKVVPLNTKILLLRNNTS